jgi:hypothetical protein
VKVDVDHLIAVHGADAIAKNDRATGPGREALADELHGFGGN